MSCQVLLPMRWAPACHRVSIVQVAVLLSVFENNQSSSPLGPPTKPSSETDIFKMSFLMRDGDCVSPIGDVGRVFGCAARRRTPVCRESRNVALHRLGAMG